MKLKGIITTLALSMTLGLGAGVALQQNKNNNLQKANAGNLNIKLLLDFSGFTDFASTDGFALHTWKAGSADTYISATKETDNDYIYSVTINPASFDGFQFIRYRSGGAIDKYCANWTKDGSDKCVVSGWDTHSWTRTYSDNSYFYFVTDNEYNRAHLYGGLEQKGDSSNSNFVKDYTLVNPNRVLHFNNEEMNVYKIPYNSNYDNTLEFKNSDNSVTSSSKTLINGAAYWWGSTAGDSDAGAALDLLIAEEEKRNAVPSGTFLQYSVCGISKTDAETLVSGYKALNASGKGYVNNSYIYTYVDKTGSSNDNISGLRIFEQLASIAKTTLNSNAAMSLVKKNDTSIIVVVVSSVSLLALGGLFFLKKKKEN